MPVDLIFRFVVQCPPMSIGCAAEMFFFLTILFLFLAVSVIVTWVNFSQIRELKREIWFLRQQLQKGPSQQAKVQEAKTEAVSIEIAGGARIERHPVEEAPVAHKKIKANKSSFEEAFGKWLPVWIGGLALALAGFFLVKYSIETGLLGPGVRVLLGVAFGVALVYAGDWMCNHPTIENAQRTSQALSGAGIADLYFSIFAASNFYEFISPTFGFLGMAVITASAVVLSLRHGMPIALMGLVGGFLTPALFSTEHPSAPVLFSYLYLVCAGLLMVIRQTKWWVLGIPSLLGTFIWVLLWLFGGHFVPDDALWLGLFLMAISATVVVLSQDQYQEKSSEGFVDWDLRSVLNYLALSGATLLMGVIGYAAGLGLMQWLLLGLLTLGGIGLAHFDQRRYGFVPWISMGVNAVMLLGWRTEDVSMMAQVILAFGLIFSVSGYVLQSRSERPLLWSGLTAAACIGYYLLGYYKLRHRDYVPEDVMFWGVLALSLAGLGIYLLQRLMQEIPRSYPYRQYVLAIYTATITAFISIGMSIELPREFLSVAIAVEMLALAWLNVRVEIQGIRYLCGVLAVLFAFLIMPQIFLLFQITLFTVAGAKIYLVSAVPIVDWPWFQLGVPAICFVASSILLRQKQDDRIIQAMEVSSIALLAIMGYYVQRHLFHVDENVLFTQASFIEAGVITNSLFLFALACFWIGRHYQRAIVSLSALVLVSLAIFRVSYFDIVFANPIRTGEQVGWMPLLNGLMVVYGLPLVWTWLSTLEVKQMKHPSWLKFAYGFMLLLAFVFVSLNVRQFFHGDILSTGVVGNGEIYAYSVAWLFFGLGLLLLGTYRGDKMIRVTSLAIMILTVGKVFLYDARELEGLFRVFSFLGLGISLMGLSWFYGKYVFGSKGK